MSNDLLDFDFDQFKFYYVDHNLETLTSKTKQLMDRVIAFNSAQLNRQGKPKKYPVTELIDFSMDIEQLARELKLSVSLLQRDYDELKEEFNNYKECVDELKEAASVALNFESMAEIRATVLRSIYEVYGADLENLLDELKSASEINNTINE